MSLLDRVQTARQKILEAPTPPPQAELEYHRSSPPTIPSGACRVSGCDAKTTPGEIFCRVHFDDILQRVRGSLLG